MTCTVSSGTLNPSIPYRYIKTHCTREDNKSYNVATNICPQNKRSKYDGIFTNVNVTLFLK